MGYYDVYCEECGAKIAANNMAVDVDAMVKKYCDLKGTAGNVSWMNDIKNMYEGIHIGMYLQPRQLSAIGSAHSENALELTCNDILLFLETRYQIHILNKGEADTSSGQEEESWLALDTKKEGEEISDEVLEILAQKLKIESLELKDRKDGVKNLLVKLIKNKDETILQCSIQYPAQTDDQGNVFYNQYNVTYAWINSETKHYRMVCPCCGEMFGEREGECPEYVVIMLGSARVGKTVYLAALYHLLESESKKLDKISVTSYQNDKQGVFEKIVDCYRKGKKPEKTNTTNLSTIALFTLQFIVENETGKQKFLIKFVDMPGEAWDGEDSFLLNKRKICRHASAFWMCIEPSQINAALRDNSIGEEKEEDSVNENLSEVTNGILSKLSMIIDKEKLKEIPLAIILTKSDKVDTGEGKKEGQKLFCPELSTEIVEGKTRLVSILLDENNNIRKEKFKAFEKIIKEYLNSRDNHLEADFEMFEKRNYFAVAAAGRKLEETNPENEPCYPSLVEIPFLWLLANFGYIGVVKQVVDSGQRRRRGLLSKISEWRNERSFELIYDKTIVDELYLS